MRSIQNWLCVGVMVLVLVMVVIGVLTADNNTSSGKLSSEEQIQLMKECFMDAASEAMGKQIRPGLRLHSTLIVQSNIAIAFFEYRTR